MTRVRFAKKYAIVVDLNPQAYSVTMCVRCGAFFGGHGSTLKESMAAADSKLAEHVCEQRTGDEPV